MRILLHLVSKIDRSQLNYRPTPGQRSTLELLRYLSIMGPELIAYVRSGAFDRAAWQASVAAADRLDFDQVLETLGRQATRYADLISEFSEADFRGEVEMFFRKASRGSIIVNIWALRVCRVPRAIVPVSQGLWPGGAEHSEPLGPVSTRSRQPDLEAPRPRPFGTTLRRWASARHDVGADDARQGQTPT